MRRQRAMATAVGTAVVMAVVAAGCATAPDRAGPEPAVAATDPVVRVMTWNLQRGQAVAGRVAVADLAPFGALIAANRADVVGLQEVTQAQAVALSAALGWPAPAYVETKQPCAAFPPPLPASCIPFGNAILSRRPVAGTDHHILPPSRLETGLEERVLLRATVDFDGLRLTIYVTHLASNATAEEREDQVAAVLARVDEDGGGQPPAADQPFRPVLVGDFNAGPASDAVAMLTGDFVDAWGQRPGDDPGFTSNAVLGLSKRIDYVFVGRSSGLRVTDVAVDASVLSDHLPVTAELRRVG